jgi:hypothetical protein
MYRVLVELHLVLLRDWILPMHLIYDASLDFSWGLDFAYTPDFGGDALDFGEGLDFPHAPDFGEASLDFA